MLIRLNYGRLSGEVVDMRVPEARRLLSEGRASLPDAAPVAEVTTPKATAPAASSSFPWPKRKRR